MVGFSGVLGIGQAEDQKMIKDKLIDGNKIVSRFRRKSVKMIRNAGSKYDGYSISPNFITLGVQINKQRFFNELSN